MIGFLTSTNWDHDTNKMNKENGMIEELKKVIIKPIKGLFIASNPDMHKEMYGYGMDVKKSFENEGFTFEKYNILDGQNYKDTEKLLDDSDLVILAGGHVPTQNKFFKKIKLRKLMQYFDGIVLSISAGTMNSANEVYAMPEEKGEAKSSTFEKFIEGLGITDINVIPHYQYLLTQKLDGLKMIEEIAIPDSKNRRFYGLLDGSYLLIKNGKTELRGEAYLIENGKVSKISNIDDKILI